MVGGVVQYGLDNLASKKKPLKLAVVKFLKKNKNIQIIPKLISINYYNTFSP